MKNLLMKCVDCGRYTLHRDKCPYCGGSLRNPHPPKYSPHDNYVAYRLRAKIQGSQPPP